MSKQPSPNVITLGFFNGFLEAQTWLCSQFLKENVAYCPKITVGYRQYKSSVHFKNDLYRLLLKKILQ